MKVHALKALIILCLVIIGHSHNGTMAPTPYIQTVSTCPGYPHGGGPLGNGCAGNGTLGPTNTPANATSTDTRDWKCIRWNESTNGSLSPNIYQFQNQALMNAIGMVYPPGSYSRSEQNAFALKAYALAVRMWGNGFEPWQADWGVCGLGG